MKYTQPRFTLPASHNTSQVQWDFSFLSKADFIEKYGEPAYKKLTK